MTSYKKRKFIVKHREIRKVLNMLGFGAAPVLKRPPLSQDQKMMIAIVRQAINNPKNILWCDDPRLCVSYIEYETGLILLSSESITIKAKNYNSYCALDIENGVKLMHFFYEKVTERRQSLFHKYDVYTLNNLNQIFNDVKTKKE